MDENRIEAREAQKKLDEAKEKLKELKEELKAPPGMVPIDQVRHFVGEAEKEVKRIMQAKDNDIQQKELHLALMEDEESKIKAELEQLEAAHEAKLHRVKAKTEKLEDQLNTLEDINEEIHKLKRKIDKKATAAVQKIISNYTVKQLCDMAGYHTAVYRKNYDDKDILLAEMEESGTIDREAMARDWIQKNMAQEDKDLQELQQMREQLRAERQATLQGEGTGSK